MSTFTLSTVVICTLFALIKGQTDHCDFKPPANATTYNAFKSLLRMPYYGSNYIGYKGNVAGVNSNGTIYVIGGLSAWDIFQQPNIPGVELTVNFYVFKTNVYDGWISYDESVGPWSDAIQESWNSTDGAVDWFTNPAWTVPNIQKPFNALLSFSHSSVENIGYYCSSQCSTSLDNVIYIVNPRFVGAGTPYGMGIRTTAQQNWPIMLQFNMSENVENYVNESTFNRELPNNYYSTGYPNGSYSNQSFDAINLAGPGCTTNNGTHIFHFNWAVNDVTKENSFQSTFAYNIETDEWSLLSGNPNEKFNFACSSDVTGRYIYLFGGTKRFENSFLRGEVELATDRYDTWKDKWVRLPFETGDYPESYGTINSNAILDSTTNQILIIGGQTIVLGVNGTTIDESGNSLISAQKIEVFQISDETWKINENVEDDLYLPERSESVSVAKVENFEPNGQNSNASADTFFIFGGGAPRNYTNFIQFMSVLSERELYPNGQIIFEGRNFDNDTLRYAFDPYQRFELAFRIVITEGAAVSIDESWTFGFEIDGEDLAAINGKYAPSLLLVRELCQCNGRSCTNMPSNVEQVTIVQLLIPSHRTNTNGYCVDPNEPWIFRNKSSSIIRLIASNGEIELDGIFELKFMQIELEDRAELDKRGIASGCYVSSTSSGLFSDFEIKCDGYKCDKCPTYPSIGRDQPKRYGNEFLKNEIEYNVLMNGVLLAPGNYVRQDAVDQSITGTASIQSFSDQILIALIRAKTSIGTWYEKCFYDVFVNETESWPSLDDLLVNKTEHELWEEVVENLHSEDGSDVIAAYTVLKSINDEEKVPEGEDVAEEITKAVYGIINETTTTIEDITTDIALVNLLFEDPAIVPPDVALNVSTEWLPEVLLVSVQILNNTEEDYDGEFAETIQQIGEIAEHAATNLLKNGSNYTESERQLILGSVDEIVNIELTRNWINESILYLRDGSQTKGERIDTDTCEFGDIAITIPQDGHATNSRIVTCVITTTDQGEVAIDLFDSYSTKIYNTSSRCFPFLIVMNVPPHHEDAFAAAQSGDWYNSSGLELPSCTFWDEDGEIWDQRGCFLYDSHHISTMLWSVYLFICIATIVDSQCPDDCSRCMTESQCNLSNYCAWNVEVCEDVSINQYQSYQIIPVPATTAFVSDECICRQEYYYLNTGTSCDCNHGLKAIKIQYTGNTVLTSIAFYHGLNAHYTDCIFTNVRPNDIMECTSFPYSQFVPNIVIKTAGNNDIDNCQASIDVSCSSNILNTVPSGCNHLKVIGWTDIANYLCPSSSDNGGVGGGRRRLISSSSDSSSSNGGYVWEPIDLSDETTTTTTTSEQETEDGTTSTTATPSPINVNPQTTALLKSAYCECASQESWDDYHYYDQDGNIVDVPRENEIIGVSANLVQSGNAAQLNDERVSVSNLVITSSAFKYNYFGLYFYFVCIVPYISIYFIF